MPGNRQAASIYPQRQREGPATAASAAYDRYAETRKLCRGDGAADQRVKAEAREKSSVVVYMGFFLPLAP